MLHEYIITAFKVLVGLLNEERLVYIAIVALGLLLLWELFSLLFSFSHRYARGVKEINEYISRNGIAGNSKEGLEKLIAKMPSEFLRGYKAFERNHKSLPSEHIKRADTLDLEKNGSAGTERLLIKTFVKFVFAVLALFNVACVANIETALTAYLLAEAFVLPLCFLFIARVISYIYAAIRQNQYKIAVDEFNEMINNFDRSAINEYGLPTEGKEESSKVTKAIQKEEQSGVTLELFSEKIYEIKKKLQEIMDKNPQEASEGANLNEESVNQIKSAIFEKIDDIDKANKDAVAELQNGLQDQIARLSNKIESIKFVSAQNLDNAAQEVETENIQVSEPEKEVEEQNSKPKTVKAKAKKEETAEKEENEEYTDNFKPDFNALFEPEAEKRGRGRPKKEVNSGEFVIKNEKEFEEALLRAEKLMRKNEEPLSASQTKRVEKQIKELIDAMNKYKEGK
ncbi:MAG: hypothetical protein IJS74_03260 [Clostridia bacterium]|nr:hypothetical protein [Clostridia bacterium]